ncbi:MAG: hypothetical protein M0Z67_18095 [Nitrospiraceae bacterium]|nr:hypothetical protein [Nitrospiraceae bacterium]
MSIYVILCPVGSRGTPSKADIEEFLKIFKSCWDGSVVPRLDTSNDETLAILGITAKHRKEEVMRLCVEDYCEGPSPDYDGNSNKEWWIFGRYVKGYEIYIKIAVSTRNDGRHVGRCMSFHIPKWEMKYPHRQRS